MNIQVLVSKARVFKIMIIVIFISTMFYIPHNTGAASTYPLDITILTQATVTDNPLGNGLIQISCNNYATSTNGEYRIERMTDNAGSFVSAGSPYIAVYNPNTWGSRISWDNYVALGHTYTYRVYYYDKNTGTSTNYTEQVTIAITQLDTLKSFTVTAAGPQKVLLNWTFPGTNEYAVVIERKADISGGTWSEIATVQAGFTSYTDTLDSASIKYFYRVKVQYAPHYFSKNVPDDTGIKSSSMLDTPGTPIGYAISPTQIHITWTGVSNATLYVIQRKRFDENSYKDEYTVQANTTEWTDNQLLPNVRYTYQIKAISGTVSSEFSPSATIACIYLDPPSNLQIQSVSSSKIELLWKDNSDKETGYEIWKKTGKTGSWARYANANKDETKFTDEDIVPDEVHYYKLRARQSDNNTYSAFSGEVSAWAVFIEPPTQLQYTFGSYNTIYLTWKDNSSRESGFIVERREYSENTWTQVGTFPANYTTYYGSLPSVDGRYLYRVKAFDNTSTNSASYSEELLVALGIPKPPTNLKTSILSSFQIKLAWNDNSDNEDGFIIERVADGNVTFWAIDSTTANVSEYIDNTAGNGSGKYYYRVKAFNKSGQSGTTLEEYGEVPARFRLYDMSKFEWARLGVETLVSRGIFSVGEDRKFHPTDKLTRGEFVSVLVKAFSLKSIVTGYLKDVGPTNKYYREIMTASRLGIIASNSKSRFYPDSYITREDMAVLTVRTMNAIGKPLKYHDLSVLDEYSDKDKISSYAKYNLASLKGESYMFGISSPGGLYLMNPKTGATKVEAALLIYRIIGE